MGFPCQAPSSHPPGLALGVFAAGGPFPRLVAPSIVMRDPAQFSPGAGTSAGVGVGVGVGVRAHTGAIAASPYRQMGLTHVLTRAAAAFAL